MTLGPGAIRPAVVKAFWPSLVVLLLTIAVVIGTKNPGWLTVGGAVISALGARLWAYRIFRQRPERADDPLPPPNLPGPPGTRAVQVNFDYFNKAHLRALDNYYGLFGVWITIAGGFVAGPGPFLLGLVWRPLQ